MHSTSTEHHTAYHQILQLAFCACLRQVHVAILPFVFCAGTHRSDDWHTGVIGLGGDPYSGPCRWDLAHNNSKGSGKMTWEWRPNSVIVLCQIIVLQCNYVSWHWKYNLIVTPSPLPNQSGSYCSTQLPRLPRTSLGQGLLGEDVLHNSASTFQENNFPHQILGLVALGAVGFNVSPLKSRSIGITIFPHCSPSWQSVAVTKQVLGMSNLLVACSSFDEVMNMCRRWIYNALHGSIGLVLAEGAACELLMQWGRCGMWVVYTLRPWWEGVACELCTHSDLCGEGVACELCTH